MQATVTVGAPVAAPPKKVEMGIMERCAKELATARQTLQADLLLANQALTLIHAQHADKLRTGAKRVAELEGQLLDYVDLSPDLFEKPQSVEFDGVRFGWRKGKGQIVLPKPVQAMKRLIGRIRLKLTKRQQEAVLKVEVKVLKGPLGKLDGDTLKKLGIKIEGTDLAPFVTYPESDFDKAVKWWLKPLGAADDEG